MERKVGGERRRDIPLNDASLNCLVSNRGQSQTPGGSGRRGSRSENPTKILPFQNLNIFYF
jgi:hypothetical protein